ncbi:MAG: ROK family transcriptional regulator [Bacillota bacterium]|nr:ROK family transcriptional regulator [Bacillota bacterium]
MSKQNQRDLREHNRSLIMETLLLKQPLSRTDLARETRLSKVTVSEIVSGLLESRNIHEIGTGHSRGGRRPVLLAQLPQVGVAIAINLAPDETTSLSTWLDGSPIDREHQWPAVVDPASAIDQVEAIYRGELEALARCRDAALPPIVGLAIAIHGNVRGDDILFTPYYSLAGLPLAPQLRQRLAVPVWIGNEANFTALGELASGAARDNFVAISVHSGIGAGIVRDNDLDVGRQGFAGEVGHTIAVPGGLSCPCGNAGCIEQYASERAIVTRWREVSGDAGADLGSLIRASQANDSRARGVLSQFIRYMGILVNNLSRFVDPDSIVINSRLTAALPQLIEEIKAEQRCRLGEAAPLVPSLLGDPAILYGGIAMVLRRHYDVRRLHFAAFRPPDTRC